MFNLSGAGALSMLGVTEWNSASYMAGNISLLDAWSHAQLSMNYSGGGSFSTDSAQSNGYFHQFGMTQTFDWRRWQLQFIDQFSYLPDTQFGFGGATKLSLPRGCGFLVPPPPRFQKTNVPHPN